MRTQLSRNYYYGGNDDDEEDDYEYKELDLLPMAPPVKDVIKTTAKPPPRPPVENKPDKPSSTSQATSGLDQGPTTPRQIRPNQSPPEKPKSPSDKLKPVLEKPRPPPGKLNGVFKVKANMQIQKSDHDNGLSQILAQRKDIQKKVPAADATRTAEGKIYEESLVKPSQLRARARQQQ